MSRVVRNWQLPRGKDFAGGDHSAGGVGKRKCNRNAKGNTGSGKRLLMKLETGGWTELRAEGTVKAEAEDRLD